MQTWSRISPVALPPGYTQYPTPQVAPHCVLMATPEVWIQQDLPKEPQSGLFGTHVPWGQYFPDASVAAEAAAEAAAVNIAEPQSGLLDTHAMGAEPPQCICWCGSSRSSRISWCKCTHAVNNNVKCNFVQGCDRKLCTIPHRAQVSSSTCRAGSVAEEVATTEARLLCNGVREWGVDTSLVQAGAAGLARGCATGQVHCAAGACNRGEGVKGDAVAVLRQQHNSMTWSETCRQLCMAASSCA